MTAETERKRSESKYNDRERESITTERESKVKAREGFGNEKSKILLSQVKFNLAQRKLVR